MKRILTWVSIFFLGLSTLLGVRRYLMALIMRLPMPRSRVRLHRGLYLAASDGVHLAFDHYEPLTGKPEPTILIRSPYGRHEGAGPFGAFLAFVGLQFARYGYNVIIGDTRGRFDSGGVFNPPLDETEDGLATLQWIKQQPWHNGVVGMWGPSYLGIVQWAVAAHAPEIKALMPIVTSTDLRSVLLPDDTLDLSLAMRWVAILEALEDYKHHPYPASLMLLTDVEKRIAPAFEHLPIRDAEHVAVGRSLSYYQTWMEHPDPNDSIWRDLSHKVRLPRRVPIHLVGGWYDFFLRGLLADYRALREQGETPYLTLSDQHHFNGMISPHTIRAGLEWFDAQLKGKPHRLRKDPVRIFVMGANEWRSMSDFPPPSVQQTLYLNPERMLSPQQAPAGAPSDHYVYDPTNPTPILGGNQFSPLAGAKDNRKLELRADVLTYTSAVLTAPIEIIGEAQVELYAHSTCTTNDFFVRLCDVHPNGRSINICDGFIRVKPESCTRQADGSFCITIPLWTTAHRFLRGHKIRLIVTSGAHPRYARNLGTEESLISGVEMQKARQTIYHDAERQSRLSLPVTYGTLEAAF